MGVGVTVWLGGDMGVAVRLGGGVGVAVWRGAHSCSANNPFTLMDARMVTVAPPSMVRASNPGFLWEGLVLIL